MKFLKLLKIVLECFTYFFSVSFIGYCVFSFLQLNANIFEWMLGIKVLYLGAVFILFLTTCTGIIEDLCCLMRK